MIPKKSKLYLGETCDGSEAASQPGTKARKGICFRTNNHNIVFWSRLLKCFYLGTEEAHNPGELCKYGYHCQAKGESESRGWHLILTLEQTNKHELWDYPTTHAYSNIYLLIKNRSIVLISKLPPSSLFFFNNTPLLMIKKKGNLDL